jgi:hypothetical protein
VLNIFLVWIEFKLNRVYINLTQKKALLLTTKQDIYYTLFRRTTPLKVCLLSTHEESDPEQSEIVWSFLNKQSASSASSWPKLLLKYIMSPSNKVKENAMRPIPKF